MVTDLQDASDNKSRLAAVLTLEVKVGGQNRTGMLETTTMGSAVVGTAGS